jgi:Cu-Zn family superoxide dismutase
MPSFHFMRAASAARTRRTLLLIPALLVSVAGFAQSPPKKAHADLMDAKGNKVGTAKITPETTGVKITASLMGLPPGMHAFHIHTVGKCDAPDFMTAGGHFNPEMKKHGKDNPMGAHAGDLQNFTVGANGKAKFTAMAPNVTLAEGSNSLFHDGGTALMIHAMADDYKTDPTGNAGGRIACGVITAN